MAFAKGNIGMVCSKFGGYGGGRQGLLRQGCHHLLWFSSSG